MESDRGLCFEAGSKAQLQNRMLEPRRWVGASESSWNRGLGFEAVSKTQLQNRMLGVGSELLSLHGIRAGGVF